jgi:hypothetical protein
MRDTNSDRLERGNSMVSMTRPIAPQVFVINEELEHRLTPDL